MSGKYGWITAIFVVMLMATTPMPVSAQSSDDDSAATTAERDAKDVLGDHAKEPSAIPEGIQQNGNAGTANISMPSQHTTTESTTRSSSHSSGFSFGVGPGNSQNRPVPGQISNQPPPPPGWPGHDAGVAQQQLTSGGSTANFDAGPIWDNNDAHRKCPNVCSRNDRVWNGDWRTVGFNKSVCACTTQQMNQGIAGQQIAQPVGPGTYCDAPANHQCPGCSIHCPAGKAASCTQGDRGIFTNPDSTMCGKSAVCECR